MRVRFLQQDDTFVLDSTDYRVLWPDKINAYKIHGKTKNSILNWFEAHELVENDLFNRLSDYESLLSRAYSFMGEQEEQIKNDEEVNEFTPSLSRLEDDLFLRIAKIWESMNSKQKQKTRQLIKSLRRLGNQISIVFHNANSEENSILMTGDIPKKFFDLFVSPELYDCYKVVKAPHHGTDSEFTIKLPFSQKLMISNGEPSTNHLGVGKISLRYSTVYGCNCSLPSTQLYCSNPRCEYLNNFHDHPCCGKVCGIPSGIAK